MKKKELTRRCPKCRRLLTYKKKWNCQSAEERKSVCRICANENQRVVKDETWWDAFRKKVSARNQKYRVHHKKYFRRKHAAWRKNNPNYFRIWRKNNHEKILEKEYHRRIEHPELKRQISRERWNRLHKGKQILTMADWNELLETFNHKCAYCGKKKKLTQDHVIPLSKDGLHTKENVVPSCMLCNGRKGVHTLQELGWKIRFPEKQNVITTAK